MWELLYSPSYTPFSQLLLITLTLHSPELDVHTNSLWRIYLNLREKLIPKNSSGYKQSLLSCKTELLWSLYEWGDRFLLPHRNIEARIRIIEKTMKFGNTEDIVMEGEHLPADRPEWLWIQERQMTAMTIKRGAQTSAKERRRSSIDAWMLL